MKYIAKMMLALLASVTLVIPAYAWDFSASGSMEATFNSTSSKSDKEAKSATSGGFASDGGSVVLKSSNTDGDHSATFSYTADWDDNMDQLVKVAGSKKVGKWTGSADVEYNIENGSQGGADKGAITLTDGTMTIKLGEASHLSGQNVSTNSSAGASKTMQSSGCDCGIGAMVGGFHGVSLGYKVSDTISATLAYQNSSDANDLLGGMDYADNETSDYGTSGFGVSANIAAGIASIGVTVGSASTKDNSGNSGTLKTTASAMGLGIKLDLGDIDPFISYGSNSYKGSVTDSQAWEYGGMEVGLTYAMGSDTVIAYFGTLTEKVSKDDKADIYTMIELGYNTTVGPASLKLGYGSRTQADGDGVAGSLSGDGATYTDIDVTMGLSF
jgi:hypothetical protein